MRGRPLTKTYQGGAIAARVGRRDTYHLPDDAGAPLCGAEMAPGEEWRQIMLNATLSRLCSRCAQRWLRQQGGDVRDWWKEPTR